MTTTNYYACSLTRWHKVTERLNKEYIQLCKAAKTGLTATSVTEYLGEAQEVSLRAVSTNSLAQLERAFAIQDAVTQIRTALGTANEREGVSVALSDYDRLVKRAAVLNSLIEPITGQRFRIDELKDIKNPPRTTSILDRGQGRIHVQTLEGEDLERLTQLAQDTTTAMYALADRIADLNKCTWRLELDPSIARLAGL
jgi:hypothetical protein